MAVPLAAQGPPPASPAGPRATLYDRLQVSGSLTTIILNTHIRVDPANGTGTDIDAEDDLGLTRSKFEPRFAVRWRPGRRHELEVGYQFARRKSTLVLDRDVIIGDSTFQLGATVDASLNSDEASLIYRFAFHTKPRREIGFSLGLGALFLDAGLEDLGSGSSVQYKLTGPIGSAGLYGRFLSGERWYWEAEARYVQVSIDRFTARVVGGGGAVRYAAFSNVLLEAGYGLTGVQLDIDAVRGSGLGSRSGRIKYTLQGVRLGAVFVP